MKLMKRSLIVLLAVFFLIAAVLLGREFLHEPGRDIKAAPVTDKAAQLVRGEYLTRAGDCMACHTTRGGKPYAGGRAIRTPFGDIYAPNITPEAETGIGSWSADDFWRALHNGRSKDGSFLYPAFPYTNYTKVTRADSDAMYAYLQTLEPVHQARKEHALRFPYNQRLLLVGWRALYFRPGVFEPVPGESVEWNRGAYLVQGLGHCAACHTVRDVLGGPRSRAVLAGGMMPMQGWYASSLTSSTDTGLGEWEVAHIASLLKTGVSERGAVFGPMAEVVAASLQYLSDEDIGAMATYLKSLPQSASAPPQDDEPFFITPQEKARRAQQREQLLSSGAKLYEKHCAECHKADGTGKFPAYPPLAGNRSLQAQIAINPVRIVLNGGYPPSTGGNPRPYGMPPFGHVLNDEEVAAVVSYTRTSWGNQGTLVEPAEVSRYRGVPVD